MQLIFRAHIQPLKFSPGQQYHSSGMSLFLLPANCCVCTDDLPFVRAKDAMLVESGWRRFTAIEVPEFEGFSSGKLLRSSFVNRFSRR